MFTENTPCCRPRPFYYYSISRWTKWSIVRLLVGYLSSLTINGEPPGLFLSCGKKIKQLQGDRNPPGVSKGNSSFTHRFTLNKIMFFPSLNKLKSKEILLKCPVLFIRIRKEGFGRNGRIPCEISCEIKFEQVVNISLLERKSAQMGIKHPF